MRGIIQTRLCELNQEFQKGRGKLSELQVQQTDLHEKLLRIGGAIQVLEEILSTEKNGVSDQKAEDFNAQISAT